MQEVDRVIADRLNSGVPLVAQVSQYIISAGGKRLRPALLLLTSAALGHQSDNRHLLASWLSRRYSKSCWPSDF
jgi:octaprenyl-diphosphate synthase